MQRVRKLFFSTWKWFTSGVSHKTSWDWLDLLLVPVFLAVGAFYLENQAQVRQQRQLEDRNNQETLTSYFEQMKELLLERKLRQSDEDSEVRSVARAITATTIRELESERNQLLMGFLRESRLLLERANDTEATENESEPHNESLSLLQGLNLQGADLSFSDLSSSDLSFTNLSNTDLYQADFSNANLSGANLSNANLSNADFLNANLSNTDLSSADLGATTLGLARLRKANLSGASLINADLRSANLSEANLSKANLRNIRWNEKTRWPAPEEVSKAHNLPNALRRELGI